MPLFPARDGATLRVRLLGRGQPVLKLNGLGMKRRDWRARIAGTRVLEHLRNEIGEISADLHEMSVG